MIAAGSVLRQGSILSERFDVSCTPDPRGVASSGRARARLVRAEQGRGRPHVCRAPSLRGSLPRPRRARRPRHRARRAAHDAGNPSPHSTPQSTASPSSPPGSGENARRGIDDTHLASEWMRRITPSYDVIYEAADAPDVASVARAARRTFAGQVLVGGTHRARSYPTPATTHSTARSVPAGPRAAPEGARALGARARALLEPPARGDPSTLSRRSGRRA